ncbi:MAG: Ig-like domain repeat protein [Chloroflexi bacterium]|nr:MAG: Ig-like domain repeat protein [Chloroflexota bacterium]
MNTEHRRMSRHQRVEVGSVFLVLVLVLAGLVMLPATAAGQTTNLTPTPTMTTTTATTPALALSTSSGLAGSNITANGSGFKPAETVDVTFNGQSIGKPTVNDGGTFSLSFTVPNVPPGQYVVGAKGQTSGITAANTFTVNEGGATLAFDPPQAAPGTSLTVKVTGMRPGETVQLSFNGPVVGTGTADTSGNATVTFSVPNLTPGQYGVTATGQTSNTEVNATYTIIAGPTPVPAAAAPTATPAPAAAPAPAPVAPPMVHDDRYFSQTGYRIDNDDVWTFFQQYGGLSTFGYPVSRGMGFLGCPVQMFQRHIIQVCASQGAALINLLDPEIFPYTHVNGSVFPAPDPTMKSNTPQVGSPTYSTDIINFVNQNVPDTWNGQQVNFQTTFNTLGGLVIWGAPISSPQPDPTNANFVYQRFQRGIMHFIAGQGTQSVLLADWLKAIIMNQGVPPDLLADSRESRYFNQYCPGQQLWLCRPGDLPGTDLTFAFSQG